MSTEEQHSKRLHSTINRRRFLLVGGAAAVSAAAGLGYLSQQAAADSEFVIDSPQAVATDDGSYEKVHVASVSLVGWIGFDHPATEVDLKSELRIMDAGDDDYDESHYAAQDYFHDGEPVAWDNGATEWVTLWEADDVPLDSFPPQGTMGGSLEYSTGAHHRGFLHSGVGDATPLIGRNADDPVTELTIGQWTHDIQEGDDPEDQGFDTRWPVVIAEGFEPNYTTPTPLETDAVMAPNDDTTNRTRVEKRATWVFHNEEGEEEEIVETASFVVEIHNIEAEAESEDGEGDGETQTDPDKTGE